ncbi:hypothetical protein Tco_1184114 [Tanacetum coccineum]
MSTMAKNVITAGADNRPPMLENSQYNSWQSRMKFYIRCKVHGKDLFDSVLNGPFKYGTVVVTDTSTTPETTRPRTYDDLTDKEKIREECDIRATNIVLQGTELSLQEQESKLYNEFDQFTSEKEESIHSYYLSHSGASLSLMSNWQEICMNQTLISSMHDPIARLNKAMDFIITTFASRYPSTNNQLRTSSNPKNQATIQDGRVIVQNVSGRQN